VRTYPFSGPNTGGLRAATGLWSLLFQEAAVLLKTAIPAACFHAQGLTRATIGNANRDRRTIRALVAIRNTDLLLAAAPHGCGECNPAVEQDKSNQGTSCGKDLHKVRRISALFHSCVVEVAWGDSNSVDAASA
jgi:hypothetical protein